ncbi:MAG: hypothetical protein OJF50_005803 [Nitrospira sp.]|nr:hypothetical protein [Nitrospira sp.]
MYLRLEQKALRLPVASVRMPPAFYCNTLLRKVRRRFYLWKHCERPIQPLITRSLFNSE